MAVEKYNRHKQMKILEDFGIRYDTPTIQELISPENTQKGFYVGYCGNEICVKEYIKSFDSDIDKSKKSNISAANGVPVVKVKGRSGMHDVVCPHCGYELFWKKETGKEVA